MSSPAVQIRSRIPRIADAAVVRARLTVVPRRRVRAARVPFVSLVSLLLLGGVVGLLLFNTSMQQASFASTALEEQAANLSARQQTLQMELEKLRDPQRVAADAQRLGMVLPVTPAYLNLADGSITGQAVPASADNRLRVHPAPPVKPASIDPRPVKVIVPLEGTPLDADGQARADGRGSDTASGSTAAAGRDGRNDSHENHQSQQSHQNQR
jgi:cell division protein FtsB